MPLNVPRCPLSTESSLRIRSRWANNESWLDYFTLFQSIIQMSLLPSWWLDEACQIMIPAHTRKCSWVRMHAHLNTHLQILSWGWKIHMHNLTATTFFADWTQMWKDVCDRSTCVWGKYQQVQELVSFNVSVTLVTDKQLKQHTEEGEMNKYSQTSARRTGYPLSQTVTLKSVKS